MPLSARVWTLPDETLARSVVPGMNRLVERARASGFPMLGNVDEYDDTKFNRLQVEVLIRELAVFTKGEDRQVAGAAEELTAMAQLVLEKPHRYLLFIGD